MCRQMPCKNITACGSSWKQEVSDQLPLRKVPSVVYVSPGGGGGLRHSDFFFIFHFSIFVFNFLIFTSQWKSEKWKRNHFVPPLGFRSLHHLFEDLFYSFLLFCSEILLITVYKTSRLVSCINFHGCLILGAISGSTYATFVDVTRSLIKVKP